MKRTLQALVSLGILSALSCGGAQPNGLTISVIPNQPIAIPYGSTTVLGTEVDAPYFIINSLNLTWSGTNNLEVVAILMSQPTVPTSSTTSSTGTTTTTAVSCGIAGDQLAESYATYNQNGTVVIPGVAAGATATTATSSPLPCSGFSLPNPLPQTLSIQVQVQVVGVIVDNAGNPTGRVTQSQTITVE